MNARRLGASAGVAAGAVGLTALFFTCFEQATLEIPAGDSRAARENPYLAAGRLLDAMGHAVALLDGPASLERMPPADAALLFTAPRRTLTPARTAALRRWVEAGGHLIVARGTDRRGDPLLEPLGLSAELLPDEDEMAAPDTDDSEAIAEDPTTEGEDEDDVSLGSFPGAPGPLRVDFLKDYVWSGGDAAQPVFRIACASGDHLRSIALGAGLLSALTDDDFLRNDSIGDPDHAEALVRLVRLGGRRRPVWIVTSERWPGLWSQLAGDAAPVLASGGALLAAWLWRSARRTGPIRPAPAPERRRWMEHLEAVGRYQWRQDHAHALLEANRRDALRFVARVRPGWAALPERECFARVGDAIGLSPATVGAALGPATRDDGASFVATLRTLETIRRKL